MRRVLLTFVLLALSVAVHAASSMDMWGCAPVGERRNVLFLVDRGTRSYVKFGTQRVNARLATEDAGQRWSWGSNAVLLTPKDFANYYEGTTLKAKFKCKRVN